MGDRYLTLAEVARRTGRHPEQLRQWCATGRLVCERIGRDWLLLESNLALVDQVAARRRRPPTASRIVVGVSFTEAAVGRRALAEAVARFRIDTRDVGLAPLAIDDVAFVLVAIIVPERDAEDAIALFEGLGGKIVADVAEGGRTAGRTIEQAHDAPGEREGAGAETPD